MPNKSLTIRPASSEDIEALAEVHTASWYAAFRDLLPKSSIERFTVEDWADRFRDAMNQSATSTALAELNYEIVGYTIMGSVRDEDLDPDQYREIWGLYVDPVHWNKGIGTKLTEWACNECLISNFQRVTLWVFEENNRARSFYENKGFYVDGARKLLYPSLPILVRYRRYL